MNIQISGPDVGLLSTHVELHVQEALDDVKMSNRVMLVNNLLDVFLFEEVKGNGRDYVPRSLMHQSYIHIPFYLQMKIFLFLLIIFNLYRFP